MPKVSKKRDTLQEEDGLPQKSVHNSSKKNKDKKEEMRRDVLFNRVSTNLLRSVAYF